MSIADMLDGLNRAEDAQLMAGADEPDRYLPVDVNSDEVDPDQYYWKVSHGFADDYVMDDPDAIAGYLYDEGYDSADYDYGSHIIQEDLHAVLVRFDSDATEHEARRPR